MSTVIDSSSSTAVTSNPSTNLAKETRPVSITSSTTLQTQLIGGSSAIPATDITATPIPAARPSDIKASAAPSATSPGISVRKNFELVPILAGIAGGAVLVMLIMTIMIYVYRHKESKKKGIPLQDMEAPPAPIVSLPERIDDSADGTNYPYFPIQPNVASGNKINGTRGGHFGTQVETTDFGMDNYGSVKQHTLLPSDSASHFDRLGPHRVVSPGSEVTTVLPAYQKPYGGFGGIGKAKKDERFILSISKCRKLHILQNSDPPTRIPF